MSQHPRMALLIRQRANLRRHLSSSPQTPQEQPQNAPQFAVKKFWKAVSLDQNPEQGLYRILLDGRPLRTPGGRTLQVPAHQSVIAHLIAGEWEAQKESLKAYSLPVVSAFCGDQMCRVVLF
jgi:chaperone required for assembly of F1-ATPase